MLLNSKKNIVIFISLIIFIVGCGDDNKVTNPPDIVEDNSKLLVNKLSVSMVPGGVEMIYVTSLNKEGKFESATMVSSDESVATVLQSGATFMVTGQNYGTATLTVTSLSGLTREIPVQIYNHEILECGELIITYTNQFQYRWHDGGSGGDHDGGYWHPIPPEGFHALGSVGLSNYSNPSGNRPTIVIKAKDPNSAIPPIIFPEDYVWVYNDAGSGATNDGSFWKPVAPPGYKALGLVAQQGWGKPALTDVVCVREDLTVMGKIGNYIWHDVGTGANNDFASWEITIPDVGPHENAYLAPGTFFGWSSYSPPVAGDIINVLKVSLPTLIEAPEQSIIPKLTSFNEPGPETAPMMSKAVLVPFSTIKDSYYSGNINSQAAASPFYRLERYVYYKLMYFYHNNTSTLQENSVLIRSGVTTTESESFWNETGVSITVEGGISLGIFSGSVSTTVSTSFGYETTSSISSLQEKEVTTTVFTAPGKAAALWQQFSRYVLKRHNGNKLEIVSSWDVGIDSYLASEYPMEER